MDYKTNKNKQQQKQLYSGLFCGVLLCSMFRLVYFLFLELESTVGLVSTISCPEYSLSMQITISYLQSAKTMLDTSLT